MDSQDQRNAVKVAFGILRRVTRIVQLLPFAYLLFYAYYMIGCSFMTDEFLCLADAAMVVTPATTILFLLASGLLKLCAWHKAACLIPASSQVEGYIDSFVMTFTQEEIIFINASIGVVAILFFIAAIHHFYGRKATTV